MSTHCFIFLTLLSYFLLCSSFYLPINTQYSHVINGDNDDDYVDPYRMNTIDELSRMNSIYQRNQRSSSGYYPRANRNTWFRVSTYQHFKPSLSEEMPTGDNLLRWGR